MPKRLLLFSCLPILSALLLSACGGGGGSDSGDGDDKAQIAAVIEKVLEHPTASDCRERETQTYVDQSNLSVGESALRICLDEGGGSKEAVEVAKVTLGGSVATAEVVFAGGAFDRQTVLMALTKDGGNWKLDALLRFVDLDRRRLFHGIRESFAGVPPGLTNCVLSEIEDLSDRGLDSLLFEGEEKLQRLVSSCGPEPA